MGLGEVFRGLEMFVGSRLETDEHLGERGNAAWGVEVVEGKSGELAKFELRWEGEKQGFELGRGEVARVRAASR